MNFLYHATYKSYLESIKKHGLCSGINKSWSDSKSVVYLANSPEIAESYAESSECIDENESLLDEIIILKIDTSKLDKNLLKKDTNVLDNDIQEPETFEYHSTIPSSIISIYNINTQTEKSLIKPHKLLKIM